MVSAHILVSGFVQGIGFRWFVRREAELLGLVGIVQNLPDGRVEIITEGEREIIEKLVDVLKVGNGISQVDSSHINWSDAEGKYMNFKIQFPGYF